MKCMYCMVLHYGAGCNLLDRLNENLFKVNFDIFIFLLSPL